MKILLVKTSSMGDILHTLPALTDAKQYNPDLMVDWVVEENFSQIPSWHPSIRQVIPVALRRWRKSWFSQETKEEKIEFIKTLQSNNYDLVIDAQGLIKSAFFIVRHAKGTKHGYNFKSAREGLASLFYDIKHPVSWEQHAVNRIRELFSKTMNYPLPTTQGDYSIADHFLHQDAANNLNMNTQPYLVFLHSTTRDEKHWPEEYWTSLLEQVHTLGFKVKLPWGTSAEKDRAKRLASKFNHVTVLPKLSLAEVANVIAHSTAVISVDTGLSHLTAALSRPNITLFGPTDPKLIGGYGENQYSIISETGVLKDLHPSIVFEKLQKIIQL
ncbi:lipopolysaccharide heptosyltransferase RfaC [Thorsellia anophelis]|uniref:lipopolysaccharide heptosyltransferase RfaC n=1 Tax=Thorsellia anophelis TaxID=336804 RepID=UPI000B82B3CE|nr:lipopolysaccharide heptosyltransferase RfaC [Thorsellia anophelis]